MVNPFLTLGSLTSDGEVHPQNDEKYADDVRLAGIHVGHL